LRDVVPDAIVAQMSAPRPINVVMSYDPGRTDSGGLPRTNGVPRAPSTPAEVHPVELAHLLEADASARDAAWEAFVASYSRLLLHLARTVMMTRDDAMDAYAHVLERLRCDDYRVLRGYEPDGRSKFATWLAVVTRRMCVDFYRRAYGRPRGEGDAPASRARRLELDRSARRGLARLASMPIDLNLLVDDRQGAPDHRVQNDELHRALDAAINELGADDRLLIKLRFEDELAAPAIASVLSLPSVFHVYRRINAACERLRKSLMARGFEGSSP
jgi:RNA polymerase sigma factor (sigma-70 family)